MSSLISIRKVSRRRQLCRILLKKWSSGKKEQVYCRSRSCHAPQSKVSKVPSGRRNECCCYFQNRVPHQELDNEILEEVFTSVKNDVSHLFIVGFPVYIHELKDKRNKLEARRRKCTFVEYCENS